MSRVAALSNNDGNLLFNEATGSSSFHILDDLNIYDTDSGKWYRTFFEVEESFYASRFYYTPYIDEIPTYENLWTDLAPLKQCYTPTPVNIIGQMSSIVPTLTQRLDGTWATTFTTTPANIYDLEF